MSEIAVPLSGETLLFIGDDPALQTLLPLYKRELLLRALAQAQGDRVVAAEALGLQRTYFQRVLKALRID